MKCFGACCLSSAALVVLACDGSPDSMSRPPRELDAGGGISTLCGAEEESFATESALHVAGDLDYPDPPPVSGNHNPSWARWGVHEEAVPDECFVHNLEHGGVVFLYHCPQGCADELAQLEQYVEGRPWALLTSYAALPSKFAVVAWGRRLVSDCFDMEAFQAFFEANVNRAPESLPVDPSSECKGG